MKKNQCRVPKCKNSYDRISYSMNKFPYEQIYFSCFLVFIYSRFIFTVYPFLFNLMNLHVVFQHMNGKTGVSLNTVVLKCSIEYDITLVTQDFSRLMYYSEYLSKDILDHHILTSS